MSFWNTFEKATTKPKQEIVKPSDILDLIEKESVFSTDSHTATRFVGPIFGINTINVPIIRDGHFFRKKETNMLISLPKQSLGYDYTTKQMDESKCPYLQYVTLDNETLLVATINYVKDSSIKDKDYLLKVLENDGLRAAYWTDKTAKDAITSSRELSMHLQSIAKRGVKEYYTNMIVYSDKHPITEAMRNTYTDMTIRTLSEQTPVSYLDYTTTYGTPVYLKESKATSAPTPVKVFKMSEASLRDLFENVVKLNTVIVNKETREKEFKGVEDPEYGCEVLVKLEETAFRTLKGAKTYMTKLAKNDRIPLTEAESKYLLWDLTKLKVEESYDQAYEFLKGMGYCDKVISNKVVTLDTPVVSTPILQPMQPIVVTSQPVATQPIAQPTVAVQPVIAPTPVASSIPAEAVDQLPWGDTPTVATPIEQPVKQMVVSSGDDFDSIFK